MAVGKKGRYEKIWLAIIPVIGSVVIALIAKDMSCDHSDSEDGDKKLRNLAGKVNQMTVYGNYDDLLSNFSDGMKTKVTRQIFKTVTDTNFIRLGKFLTALDTTQNMMRGSTYYYIKNQHERGQSMVVVSFDNNDKIITLFFDEIPQ